MVISNNIAGLCNRIKSLLSAMRIAEFNKDSEVKVDWPLTAAVGECHFTDLFENENMIIRRPDYPSGATTYSFWRFAILPSDPLPINFSDGCGVRYNNIQKSTGHTHTNKEGRNIDLEFDRIPEEIRLDYLKQLKKLKIKNNILQEVKNFSKKFNNNTVSVQIRSWNDDPIKQKLFNIEDFYKLMDSMVDNNFFVTADTSEIIKKMKERYGDKIITRENYQETMGHRERGQKQGVIDAMVDLLLLSKNKTLIGTYVSTFSEMSWWFSDCKQKTYIL
jgi:hypothetical protein